jgi:type II secretory pathway pseudopilin PulG
MEISREALKPVIPNASEESGGWATPIASIDAPPAPPDPSRTLGVTLVQSFPGRRGESGFTLAGLIVILTVIAIIAAFTIPDQWSKIMQRDRERQTIFVMKQYARAIHEWQAKHGGGFPTSLDQMKEARLPRIVRGPTGELLDPLTGKMDWIMIPPGAYTQQPPTTGPGPGPNPTPTPRPNPTPAPSNGASPFNAAASPKDYKGPFIGVRPPVSGKAMLKIGQAENYEEWFYTVYELNNEIANHIRPSPFK